jgi:hypothetical protein
MKRLTIAALVAAVVTLLGFSTAQATTAINADITTSTTWTKANSPYALKKQIFVRNGATLTIEAGVVVASFADDQGSLAVCRGAKIFANGTAAEPIIMTSANDVATWSGSVTTTGTSGNVTVITTLGNWRSGSSDRHVCNEWGNLTVMGKAIVSNSLRSGNTPNPSGLNVSQMEGLSNIPNDTNPNVLYGGADDNDDSGALHYLQSRYGGIVVGFGNELNGLSMGGIGRETDVDHIEIFENVDDGIETWGGTVNYKYISVWQIGDDNFDVDQGWRGKAQFGLLVQGWSRSAVQGSGTGDNVFEMDGAEDSDAQPQTAGVIYNFTCIGQPGVQGGDQGTAWRDNCHMQFRRCIWMDLGEQLVAFDGSDGDSSHGYGYNGTLPWADCWTTAASEAWNLSNTALGGHANITGTARDTTWLHNMYAAQVDGNLCEIKDSVFYNNTYAGGTFGYPAISLARSTTGGVTQATVAFVKASNTLNLTTTGGANYSLLVTDTNKDTLGELAGYINTNCSGWTASVVGDVSRSSTAMNNKGTTGALAPLAMLLQINGTVGSYTEAVARGVDGTINHNVTASASPIATLARAGTSATLGGATIVMTDIVGLDPRAANDALTCTHGVGFDPPAGDKFFTNAPYRGAFSSAVNWLKGWTNLDAVGKLVGPANPADPSATGAMTQVKTVTTFSSVLNAIYTIEKSTDMKTWQPVTTVIGTGNTMTVEDLDSFDNAKFYRAVRQ